MKLFPIALSVGHALRQEFHGDKVFRLTVADDRQLAFFHELGSEFDIWKEPRFIGDNGDVHVSREFADLFEMKLMANRIGYTTMIDDVEKVVSEQFENAAAPYENLRNFEYDKYHTFEDNQAWQSDFVEENSDIVSLTNYGYDVHNNFENFGKFFDKFDNFDILKI